MPNIDVECRCGRTHEVEVAVYSKDDIEVVGVNTSYKARSGEPMCKHCKHPIAIRNPSGYCDHLHYPEYCPVCKKREEMERAKRIS